MFISRSLHRNVFALLLTPLTVVLSHNALSASIAPDASALPAPTQLTAKTLSSNAITLNWTAPQVNGSIDTPDAQAMNAIINSAGKISVFAPTKAVIRPAVKLDDESAGYTNANLINQALTNAAGGGVVQLPPGNLYISKEIVIAKSKVILRGSVNSFNENTTNLKITQSLLQLHPNTGPKKDATGKMIKRGIWHGSGGFITIGKLPLGGGAACSQAVVEKLNISFPHRRGWSTSNDYGDNIFYINQASQCIIKDIRMVDFECGVIATSTSNNLIQNIWMDSVRGGHFGIMLSNSCTNTKIDGITSVSGIAHELTLQSCSNNVFMNCTLLNGSITKNLEDGISFRGGNKPDALNNNVFKNILVQDTPIGGNNAYLGEAMDNHPSTFGKCYYSQVYRGTPNSKLLFNSLSGAFISLKSSEKLALAPVIRFVNPTGGPTISNYDVYRGASKLATTAGLTYTDSGLLPNTNYSYKVLARDTSGNLSPASNTVFAKTLPALADSINPSTPQNLSAAVLSGNSIRITWSASTDNSGSVSGYDIYRGSAKVSFVTSPSYTDSGLTPGTSYTYSVIARDPSGNSSAPGTVSAKTLTIILDTVIPSTPQSLSATVLSDSSIKIGWLASTDNSGFIAGYEVYRGTTQVALVTSTAFTDTALSAATSYSYRVVARDPFGNKSLASTAIQATTLSTVVGTTVFQAEKAVVVGARIVNNYVDFINNADDHVEWTVHTASAGSFPVKFNYALYSTSARLMQVQVNGVVVSSQFSFASTGSWDKWLLDGNALSVTLKKGVNTIRLTATGSSGPNLDYLTVTGSGILAPLSQPMPDPQP